MKHLISILLFLAPALVCIGQVYDDTYYAPNSDTVIYDTVVEYDNVVQTQYVEVPATQIIYVPRYVYPYTYYYRPFHNIYHRPHYIHYHKPTYRPRYHKPSPPHRNPMHRPMPTHRPNHYGGMMHNRTSNSHKPSQLQHHPRSRKDHHR